ncbi:MAG: FtsX-like permease family protein [Bacteroidales bacterium]|nr:FtsX-like permease family protein [Bacteroidales bacterium]
MNNLIFAWRNLWRNRRRSMITSASIFFAVFFALVMRSIQLGSYDHMYKNAIESYSGYIQVQQKDFWDEKIVDNTFCYDPELEKKILNDENVTATIPRFESFALASNGPKTKGVLVMGVDPGREKHLSKVLDKMVAYQISPEAVEKITRDASIPEKTKELLPLFENSAYANAARLQLDLGISNKDAPALMPAIKEYCRFENKRIHPGEPGVWVGYKLSQYLDLGIGDTLVLISQGYHATTAAGKYEIKGIVKLPLPDIDNKIVYLPLDICQGLFNAEGNLTSLALSVQDNRDKAIDATVHRIRTLISEDQTVMEWRTMNEVMVSQMEADNKSGMIMLGILYLVIAFGVFGTVLMLTAERRREFGVLVAIGMQKKKLASIMTIEILLMGLLGILAGLLAASVIILYGVEHPLLFKGEMALMFEDYGFEPKMAFWSIDTYYIWQMVIVALMVLIAIGYPLRKIFGMKVVNALRA